MSTKNVGSSAPVCGSQPEQGTKPCKCRCRWWTYGGLLLLIVVAIGAWVVYQQIGGKLRSTPQYQAAIEKIRSDERLRDALGAPITDSWRTAGEAEDMYFDVQGPKGSAKVYVKARRAQGKWELIQLEATIEPSGKKISVPLGGAGDAPPFQGGPPADANKAPPGGSPPAAPADAAKPAASGTGPELKFDVPSAPAGGS